MFAKFQNIFIKVYHTEIQTPEFNKICHRDRIARLTAPCPSHKNLNVKLKHFANADAAADARGSTIALPGLRPGELKNVDPDEVAHYEPPY